MNSYFKILFIVFTLLFKNISAQKKYFNGTIKFANTLTSTIKEISEEQWKQFLFMGDTTKYFIFEYNSKKIYGEETVYKNPIKSYKKYAGIDSLFNIESDTSRIIDYKIEPLKELYFGYKCNKITIKKFNEILERIVLDSTIYENWFLFDLYYKMEVKNYFSLEAKTISIEENNKIENETLVINLPISRIGVSSIIKNAEFIGGTEGWVKYLTKYLNADLGSKYIKIPKGENSAKSTVRVNFIIDETGKIINPFSLNPFKAHLKLVEEAIRVLKLSPNWQPMKYKNRNIMTLFAQNITFAVSYE